MKKLVRLFVFLIALQYSARYLKAEEVDRNGNWWISLERSDRVHYILGVFDGTNIGRSILLLAKGSKEMTDDGCASKAIVFYNEQYLKNKNVTSRQLVDGLDSFYGDYRNRLISLEGGIWIVQNTIGGTPQAEIDRQIERARRGATR